MDGGIRAWFGYTQTSFWQLYADSEASSPFRETNHEPEVFWNIPTRLSVRGFEARLFSLSINHQSNGRSKPLSRSWNRLTAQVVLEKDHLAFTAKTWVRIDGESDDDNPNIEVSPALFALIHKRCLVSHDGVSLERGVQLEGDLLDEPAHIDPGVERLQVRGPTVFEHIPASLAWILHLFIRIPVDELDLDEARLSLPGNLDLFGNLCHLVWEGLPDLVLELIIDFGHK